MEQTVDINECFARDGLQHESTFIPADVKVALLESFVDAGFRRIEATSYSNPAKVPAFADASEVLEQLPRKAGVAFKATCANTRSVERALADEARGFGAEEISLLSSASNAHSLANLRTERAGQWQRIEEMVHLAQRKFTLVGVVSVAFGCPFEGTVDPASVVEDVARFRDLGAGFVTIGDTTGLASPDRVRGLFRRLARELPGFPVVAHFHDTRGLGIANVVAAFEEGCTRFDSALGGVGGHPAKIHYGTGNTGNVATEDVVNLFETMGISTGLDLAKVMEASRACERALDRQLDSQVARAGWSKDILQTKETAA